MREFLRSDVLFRFVPLWGGDFGPAKASLGRFQQRCAEKVPSGDAAFNEAFGPLHRFGVLVVREALDEARAANPTLAIRPAPPEELLTEGWTETVTVMEAQRILDFIGFGPLEHDGRMGPMTSSSLRAFQDAVGVEADGNLDRRTGALLRNAAFNGSTMPVKFIPASRLSGGSGERR